MEPADLDLVVLAGALVLLAAVAAVRLSTRAGLPSLLVYLGIGLAIGESGLGLRFEDAELVQVLGNVALAMILAEGGFTTRWSTVRPVAPLAAVLATVGVFLSVAVTSGLAYGVLDVDLRTAIVLGAVASSTDAAAVFAVLRQMAVRGRLRAVVEVESGFNDPPVIILVTVVTSDAWDETGALGIAGLIGYQLLAGVVLGAVVARAGVWLLVRSALPAAGLYPLATVAIAFVAFAVSGLAGASALMAIYVAGLVLGNARLPHRGATDSFVEGLAWLAQIGLFIMLGLLASPSRLLEALPTALVVGSALTLVARPLSVLVCATPFRVPLRDQAFISWAGLRGAVPIVLATIPMSVGLPGAERIFDVVFLLVVLFTLIQGPTLPWVARRTGAALDVGPRDVAIDAAPLDELDATLLQFAVPPDSRLAGVEVSELRFGPEVAVALVLRQGALFVPHSATVLRGGDQVLLAAPRDATARIERRLRQVGREGRLAGWYADLPRRRGVPPSAG
ncbi:potassium/proton antiporter [Nocardioides sp. dk4132]|uniref:potassium/proton antiporter n=1 Tax=unclassified Nocardioides TaxID=2615069 RepID=UPI001297FB3A|nr:MULTISPECIES: potassium/proton antiporter [unclassified Nocardioides]MQW75608.1 potassium/proton antiporter [Nocardioides sp. dk4132]QGA08510.1 potassium/proton antiporter [Nocardioides sp. dk884]